MSVIDNSNLGTLWNRILGLFSARKINNKSLAKDITINDEDIPSTAVNGETTVEGALGNIADQLSNQSQQIDNLQAADAYVENGDTAQLRTYAAGDFIMWKGVLHTVNSEGIIQGTAITGHLTRITDGGLNFLKTLLGLKVQCNGWRGTVKNLYTLIGVGQSDSAGIMHLDISNYTQQKPVFGIIQCLSNPNCMLMYNFDESTITNIKIITRNIATGSAMPSDYFRYSFIFCDQQ